MKYALVSYGISPDALPLDANGYVIDTQFRKDVAEQREVEEEIRQRKADLPIIEYPNQRDVLLGRGKPIQDFPGNIRLNILVEQQRTNYESLNKGGKSACIAELVHSIHQMGGRFLIRSTTTTTTTTKEDDDGDDGLTFSCWEEVDLTSAHKKVNNCFQTRKDD